MFGKGFRHLQKTESIRHEAFENLSVIPYVRGRLVFAEMAVRVIQEGMFDRVVVDLPYFMNMGSWLNFPLDLFPSVSALIIKREDSSFATFPFVPNDAACAAAAHTRTLKQMGNTTEFYCIDDSNVVNYPEEWLAFGGAVRKDDYHVFTDGIEEFFQPVFGELERAWYQLDDTGRLLPSCRAGLLSKRLTDYLMKGGHTLFICEYKKWWLVSKVLSGELSTTKHCLHSDWRRLRAVFAVVHPWRFWVNGLLDDYPAVVFQFYRKMQECDPDGFDKLEALEALVKGTMKGQQTQSPRLPSLRSLIGFEQFLVRMLTLECRHTPSLVSHLYPVAQACLGKEHAGQMTRALLEYPCGDVERVMASFDIHCDWVSVGDDAFDVSGWFDAGSLNIGQEWHACEASYDHPLETKERKRLIGDLNPWVSASELRQLREGEGLHQGTIWAVQQDYTLHGKACRLVRQAVERDRNAWRVERSCGDTGEGICWDETIASIARGEDDVYIKVKDMSRGSRAPELDEYTPIVFVIGKHVAGSPVRLIYDSNATRRNIDLGNKDPFSSTTVAPDCVYSVLYASSACETACEGHIMRFSLSCIAFLYTLHSMGSERYRKITKRPRRYQCRVEPACDPDLAGFTMPELAVAWAVKYAQDTAIVVGRDGWRPTKDLQVFSRMRGVSLLFVPLTVLSAGLVQRLEKINLISTALKKHPARDRILERFIA